MKDNKENFKIDFIGIGAARCATSWIYKCLLEHPQICGPFNKELNFFRSRNMYFGDNFDRYESNQNHKDIGIYKEYFSHCSEKSIKGEFSVQLLNDPGSPTLIKEMFPEIKVLVCLRDPVERAYSLYWYAKEFMLQEKNDTFENAIQERPDIYLDSGMYFKHLQNYLKYFSGQSVGIFLFDDIQRDPVGFMQNIYKFLGVNEGFIAPSAKKGENTSKKVRFSIMRKVFGYIALLSYFFKKQGFYFLIIIFKKMGMEKLLFIINNRLNAETFKRPVINPQTERKLREVFKNDIEKLEGLIDRDLSQWK